MKKSTLVFVSLFIIIALTFSFSGCGSKNMYGSAEDGNYYAENINSDYAYEAPSMASYSKMMSYSNEPNTDAAPAAREEGEETPDGAEAEAIDRKLIKNADIDVQTKEFDEFLDSVDKAVAEAGGYTEGSDISGNSIYGTRNRYATLTLRIPAEKFDTFISAVDGFGTVTDREITVSDITSAYIDTASRIKALEAEQTALTGILENADNVTDTLEIYSRLSDVNAELDAYRSKLATYDRQVAYSEICIHVSEVERVEVVEEEGFFEEIKRKLVNNLKDIGEDARAFAVWFISSLPDIIIFVIAVLIAVKIIKVIVKKRKAKSGDKPKKEKKSRRKNKNQTAVEETVNKTE